MSPSALPWVVSGRDIDNRPKCAELSDGENENLSLQGRWVNSHDLVEGDILFDHNGTEQVVRRVTQLATPGIPVSNLTIEGNRNYAVGSCGILVHNVALCQGDIDRYVAEVVTDNKTLDEVLQPLIDEGVKYESLQEIVRRSGRTPSDEIVEAILSSPSRLIDDLIEDSNPAFRLTRENAIEALEPVQGSKRIEVAGSGGSGADIQFIGNDDTILLAREVKCIGAGEMAFKKALSKAVKDQLSGNGNVFMQVRSGSDVNEWVRSFRNTPGRDPNDYANVTLTVVDETGSTLFSGRVMP